METRDSTMHDHRVIIQFTDKETAYIAMVLEEWLTDNDVNEHTTVGKFAGQLVRSLDSILGS